MKHWIIVIYLIKASMAPAQITFDRSVLSPFALTGTTGNNTYSSTGGQVDCATWNNGDFYLTEGFEQPQDKGQLSVWYSASYDPCNTTYTVRIDSVQGCSAAESVQITWNYIPGDLVYTTAQPGLRLLVSGAAGCSFLQYIDLNSIVGVIPSCELIAYTILTPNGDGKNDFFQIENIGRSIYSENKVSIVNRWGQCVWEASGYNNEDVRWTGADKEGRPLADGTYYYFIEAGSIRLNGFLELTR